MSAADGCSDLVCRCNLADSGDEKNLFAINGGAHSAVCHQDCAVVDPEKQAACPVSGNVAQMLSVG
jgi:hypothetical protein